MRTEFEELFNLMEADYKGTELQEPFKSIMKRIGEWAWSYADSRIPLADRDSLEQMCLSVTGGSIMEIAVACLGKEEIEKRLKSSRRGEVG